MKILTGMSRFLRNVSEAFVLIFSPDHDEYPKIGVQPFEGTPYDKRHRHSN